MTDTQKAVKSSFLIIAATWIKRVIGVVSIIILARFLSPSDYGIVAIGLLVLRFFEVISETGINQYVLSRKEISDEEMNTAWTLKLLTRVVLGLLLIVLSAPIARFFENPDLVVVLFTLAFIPFIQGLESPSLLILSRALEYKKIALLTVIAKLSSFAVTVTIAFLYQSYWALIIGDLVLAVVTTSLSYMLLSYKPKFTVANWRKQWQFSQWIFYKGIVGYSRAKFDVFVIGKFFEEIQTGLYTMSKHLILMPFNMLAAPVVNIMITTISQETKDIKKARETITLLIYTMFNIMFPIVVGVVLVAPFAIPLVLGEQWTETTPLIQAMIVISLFTSVNSVIIAAMNAFEIVKRIFILDLFTFVVTVIAIYLMRDSSLSQFSYLQSAISLFTLSLFLLVIKHYCQIPLFRLFIGVSPSLLSAGLCFFYLQNWGLEITVQDRFIDFIKTTLSVVILYILSFSLLSFAFSRFSKENAVLVSYVYNKVSLKLKGV